MISSYDKMASIQIVPKMLYECHNSQKLFLCGAIITLGAIQSPTGIGYHFLLSILDLGKDSTHAVVASIRVKNKLTCIP